MLLTETRNAWDVIGEWVEKNVEHKSENDRDNEVYSFCCELTEKYDYDHLKNCFDFLVCNEFPNGCDKEELIDFFSKERKLILENM